MGMAWKVEGERDKDNCPLSYFNLDVQGPEFFRVEAIISHVTCHMSFMSQNLDFSRVRFKKLQFQF